jgi:hypothetical protein
MLIKDLMKTLDEVDAVKKEPGSTQVSTTPAPAKVQTTEKPAETKAAEPDESKTSTKPAAKPEDKTENGPGEKFSIRMDDALFIRILELVNENKMTDEDLHVLIERIETSLAAKEELSMEDYDVISKGFDKEQQVEVAKKTEPDNKPEEVEEE